MSPVPSIKHEVLELSAIPDRIPRPAVARSRAKNRRKKQTCRSKLNVPPNPCVDHRAARVRTVPLPSTPCLGNVTLLFFTTNIDGFLHREGAQPTKTNRETRRLRYQYPRRRRTKHTRDHYYISPAKSSPSWRCSGQSKKETHSASSVTIFPPVNHPSRGRTSPTGQQTINTQKRNQTS